jgi:addiction module RelE/StbE family toxin
VRVRWTAPAADDLAHIVEYIHKDNPAAARRVAQTIYKGVAMLRASPRRGRIGLVENTRELIFAPWPYVAVYEIIEDHIQVLRVRHTAQDWP